jgi:hypothetical protein
MLPSSPTDRSPAPMHQLTSRSLLAVMVVVLAACGGGDGASAKDVKADVAAQVEGSGLAKADAACFADAIVDDLGAKTLKDVDFSADAPPAGDEGDFTAAAMKALTTCDINTDPLRG